jgi:2'-5' RNA ligase
VASYTIVAIPSNDDYVWRISSAKVPHLTLLFLGDHLENVGPVQAFIGHAVDTVLSKFVLEVDRRGPLGDKNADVLFFGKYGVKKLEDFRSYLLTNPNVRNAYDSTEQFSSWTPHLTLGYPETPAKNDKREYLGMNAIVFDRLALWTGDYEGVEFPLKSDSVDEVRMTAAKGEIFLQHYGTKGMKWGVRRAERAAERRSAMSDDARTADDAITKAKTSGVHTTSNRELQNAINRMNLEQQYDRIRPLSRSEKVGRFIAGTLLNIGKNQARQYAQDKVGEAIKNAKSSR